MKIQPSHDTYRKHARVPRSYREATGKHLSMRSSDHEPAWVPIIGGVVFSLLLALLFFWGV